MEAITEEMIDMVWHEMTHLTPEAAKDGIMSLGEEQPALLDFFMPYSDALQPEAQSYAVFLFYAVCRLFDCAYGEASGKLGDEEIDALYDINEKTLGDLESLTRARIKELSEASEFVQPIVVSFIADILFGEEDDEEESLDEYELYDRGMTFLLMKTVIDSMDALTYEEEVS